MEREEKKEANFTNMADGEHHREEGSSSTVINGGDGDDVKDNETSSSSSISSSCMAKGLSNLITSVIQDFDSKAEAATNSQNQLNFSLDRLTSELDQLLDDAPLPFIMQHAARISGVRKRVTSLNLVLKSIQRRVDNIDRMLSTGFDQQGNTGPNI